MGHWEHDRWIIDDTTGPAPTSAIPYTVNTPINYSFILQAILNTLKEIQEELVYIKNMSRY